MSNKRNMSIVFSSGLNNLTEYNSSFDKGILRVAYTGKNKNNSFISKSTFESCIQSIYNCPIVCRYDRETDEIGAHDIDVVRKDDGAIDLVNITHPVGVIPESGNYYWEEIEEDDGVIHEYLCVDALLWKRQEAYKKIKEDGITEESMEISIKNGSMKDGVYVIEDFEFTAFCLLGTARPCFESASLLVFSQDEFKAQLNEMMHEFKESIFSMQDSQGVDINFESNLEGSKSKLDEKIISMMTSYGLTEDMLDFSPEDFSEAELREKFEAISAKDKSKVGAKTDEDFALARQHREELIESLSAEKVDTYYGETSRYWYEDHDDQAMEVYCYDCEEWRLYGFKFSNDGDRVVIDFDSKKRKRFSIVDFDEGDQTSAFAAIASEASKKYAENDAQWAAKYQKASETISSANDELSILRKYKADVDQSINDQALEELFAQFEDIAGVEAFENLKGDCDQYSIDEIEEKCYAIRGRTQAGKFSLQTPKIPKLPIEKSSADTEPYGGIFAEYGIQPATSI